METTQMLCSPVSIEGEHVDLIKRLLSAPSPLGMRAFMLTGPAGTGKTAVTRQLADFISATYTFIQCTAGMDEGEILYKMLPSEETIAGVKIIPGKLIEAIEASTKGKVVLVLDEWDKTRPSADAFLLDFLQNCRVSWRINEASMYEGCSANLVVFLTSNAEREFSEPLLRRVITIKLVALTPAKMAEVLEKYQICAEHIPLLVQLYADTQAARLDKPATVQELVQLEQALHMLGDIADWDQLVYSFVVKTDEAWNQLVEYLARADKSRKVMLEDKRASIVEKYNEPGPIQAPTPIIPVENRVKMPRLAKRLAQVTLIPEPAPALAVDAGQSLVMADEDGKASSEIIKTFFPEATKDPAKFGEFMIIRDGGKKIVRERPLTFAEITSGVFTSRQDAEAFADDDIPAVSFTVFVPEMLKQSTRVLYYTRNTCAGEIIDKNYPDRVVTWRADRCNVGVHLQVHAAGITTDLIKQLVRSCDSTAYRTNYAAVKHAAERVAAILNKRIGDAKVSCNDDGTCYCHVLHENMWSVSDDQITKVIAMLRAARGVIQPAGGTTNDTVTITVHDWCTVTWAIGSYLASHIKYEAGMHLDDMIARLEAARIALEARHGDNLIEKISNLLERVKRGEDKMISEIVQLAGEASQAADKAAALVVPFNPSGDEIVAGFIAEAMKSIETAAERAKAAVEMVKMAKHSIAARKAVATKNEGKQI